MNKIIAMIPVRMGSQRLKRKNMQHLQGIPLVTHAIRKCIAAGCFDEIWVNSESIEFQAIALDEGAYFHNRPQQLGDNETTSEQFISEFLETKDCTHLVQVHSIAPLLSKNEISAFVEKFTSSDLDVLLSAIEDQIEVAYLGQPVNFTFQEKTNSQDLRPVQRITWSITGWKRDTFLDSARAGSCATYAGEIGFFPVNPISGHVIKTREDLDFAELYLEKMD